VTVSVDPKRDIEAELNDKGFKPPVIRIDEGTAIQWKWSGCEVAHIITEATYSQRTGKLHAVDSDERSVISSCPSTPCDKKRSLTTTSLQLLRNY